MTINANHENTVLVAPRPVRLATAVAPFFHSPIVRPQTRVAILSATAEAFDRLVLGDDQHDYKLVETGSQEREPLSPRASPRSSLPSEALEEFLSILQPSGFRLQPNSPVLRTANGSAFFSYRRQTPCSLSPTLSEHSAALSIEHDETRPSDPYPFKLLGGNPLSSPVSRMQTRNPFQRHASYEPYDLFRGASVASPTPTSPSAIPLPSPTPDEMDLEPVS